MARKIDTRTQLEKIDDMIADDIPLKRIADLLFISYPQVRARYLVLCHKFGERPSDNC